MSAATPEFVTHRGGCHCGAIRFEVDAPARLLVHDCNCTICSMSGFQHLIVPGSRFRLLAGAEMLAEYTFNTGVARHLFCRRCGFSVNARCLDAGTIEGLDVAPFDGRNWEESAGELRHLSSG
jgi:hypothetical protein